MHVCYVSITALLHFWNMGICYAAYCTPNDCQLKESYDFIIVGGGTAGCVLGNRLSENPQWNVLILEAGGKPPDGSRIPFLAGALENEYRFTWNVTTTRQDICQINGGYCLLPEAMMLGGTSSLWPMDYLRGMKKDFDLWEAEGNPGWSWSNVLNYFLKAEQYIGPANLTSLGTNGPWIITPSNSSWLLEYFMAALREVGLKEADIEDGCSSGFGLSLNTIDGGERVSTFNAYLDPVLNRRNLDLMTWSMVTKILVGSGMAKGVEFVFNNVTYKVYARKEVIVACGAINSPKLLMLSGIGPGDHLKYLGIPVVQDLPVGSICKDKPSVNAFFRLNKVAPYTGKDMVNEIKLFIRNKTGLLTEPVGRMITALTHSSQSPPGLPDSHLYIGRTSDRNVVSIGGYCTRPESQGTLRLRSRNFYDAPLVDPKLLTSPKDAKCMAELIQLIFRIGSTTAARSLGSDYLSVFNPACPFDANLADCLIKQYGRSLNHVSGTCKMGPTTDPYAVVDNELRVYNVSGLRVVDSSVIPLPTAGTRPPTVVMMAEKIADIIKRDYTNCYTNC